MIDDDAKEWTLMGNDRALHPGRFDLAGIADTKPAGPPIPPSPAREQIEIDAPATRPQARRRRWLHDGARPARVAGLDALRGVAVALVMVNHASPVFAGAGIVGVSIFFVLSGYLITGVLRTHIERRGRVGYLRFYRARALRLIPALVAMLVVFALVEGVADAGGQRADLPRALAVALTYTSNLPGINTGFDSLFHLWSLAVEEQFYLAWPLLLTLGLRRWGWQPVLLSAAAASLLTTIGALAISGTRGYMVYTLPTTWSLGLILGAGLQLAGPRLLERFRARPGRRAWAITAAAVFLAAAILLPEPSRPTPWIDYLLLVRLTLLAAAVLVLNASGALISRTWMRPLIALGTISYAVYLWDLPMTVWLGGRPGLGILLPGLAAIGAATASWWLLERPAMAWRRHLDASPPRRGTPSPDLDRPTTPRTR